MFLLLFPLLLIACSIDDKNEHVKSIEEKDGYEITDKKVELYMHSLTAKFGLANTKFVSQEKKMQYYNEAITDINITVQEIEDKHDENEESVQDLLKLAEKLLLSIESDMLGEDIAVDYAREAGKITSELAKKHTEGELPFGIQKMTGIENVND